MPCNSCKYWSELQVRKEGSVTISALCLAKDGPYSGDYTKGGESCCKFECGDPIDLDITSKCNMSCLGLGASCEQDKNTTTRRKAREEFEYWCDNVLGCAGEITVDTVVAFAEYYAAKELKDFADRLTDAVKKCIWSGDPIEGVNDEGS